MEVASENEVSTAEAIEPAVEAGARFLQALFDQSDTILFRPIETWVEAGRNRSHVDYRNTCYRKAMPVLVHTALKQLARLSERDHLNIFFGVCPRLGSKGRFDLAWQIRTVRALWADIDHVMVDEVVDRVAKAGLPQPSIVVNSGNGVHLYWLLEQPYLIDDAGDPPPVHTEWVDGKGGKKKGLKYIQEAGADERLYLEKQANVPELSPKATHVQDIVAGIAAAIGGDHTHDLARLLRVPGTFNRKDERNGHPPMPCELVECEPGRKYQLSDFAKFADASPQKAERQKIAAVSLPLPKPLTPTSDNDHTGGAISILNDYQDQIRQICVIQDHKWLGTLYWQRIDYLIETGVLKEEQVRQLLIEERPKELWHDGSKSRIKVLSPALVENLRAQAAQNANATSAVIVLDHLGSRFVFAADSEIPQWRRIYERRGNRKMTCDVLSVPHHGGLVDDSHGDLDWLYEKAIAARFAVLSVGTRTNPKHPREEVVAKLITSGSTVICTEITVKCHKRSHILNPGVLKPLVLFGRAYDASSKGLDNAVGCAGTVLARVDASGVTIDRLSQHQAAVDAIAATADGCPICR